MNHKTTLGLFVLAIVAAGGVAGTMAEKSGYKAGQIDAMNGEIKYELVEQPNGEMKWVEKD